MRRFLEYLSNKKTTHLVDGFSLIDDVFGKSQCTGHMDFDNSFEIWLGVSLKNGHWDSLWFDEKLNIDNLHSDCVLDIFEYRTIRGKDGSYFIY